MLRKHRLLFIRVLPLLALLALLLLASGFRASAADSRWNAKFWNNRSLNGTPVLERQDSDINFDWGGGSPAPGIVSDDNFSARWSRTMNFSAGTYRFTATADDGVRVWVDDNKIIDAWNDSQVRTVTGDIYLGGGEHRVRMEFYEAGGMAVAKLSWAQVGGPGQITPARWRGEYFNNMSLSGSPSLVRDDDRIDFNWGGGSPAPGLINADRFSVRWTRSIALDPGRYRFTTVTDDGVRLWVNDQLIINEWHDNQSTPFSAEIDIPSGVANVRMEYFENAGGAVARLSRELVRGIGTPTGPWRGEYFNNKTLSGSAALVRNDGEINFNWGAGSPAPGIIGVDNFSVRWTRTVPFSAGRYRFTALSDDGVRVWVNGRRVIDGWYDHEPRTFSADVDVPAGNIPIQVEYYEAGGNALVQFGWTQLSAAPQPTPQAPTPSAGTGLVVSYRLNVRTGPGTQFAIITSLNEGQTVALTGYRSPDAQWAQIRVPNSSLVGWVFAGEDFLETSVNVAALPVWEGGTGTGGTTTPQPPGAPGTAVVSNARWLNVRSSPEVSDNIITVVSGGTRVQMLGRDASASWIQVRLPNNVVGWVSSRYLSSTTPYSSLPVTG